MPSAKEIYLFDVGNWKGKPLKEITSDASSGIIEASDAALIERVNPVATRLEVFARWSDEKSQDPVIIASTKIHKWALDNQTKGIEIWLAAKEPTESEILEALKPFSDFNPSEVMVWFSPRNSTFYKEGTRIGIYQVIYVNGEKYLFFRTLCNFDYGPECAKSAASLLPYSSLRENPVVFSDSEILRATPLPLNTPGNSLSRFFEHHLNFPPNLWKALSQGKDIETKMKITQQMAGIFTPEVVEQINQAQSFGAQRKIGIYLEKIFQDRTERTLRGGVCGLLYSSHSLSPFAPLFSVSGIPSSESGRRVHCGRCGKHGYFTEGESCPYD